MAELEDLRCAISKSAEISEEKSYLTPVFPQVNSAGALLINHLRHFAGEDSIRAKPPAGSIARVLDAAAQGELGALVIIDWDLLANYPDRGRVERALAGVDKVIYCGAFENETSRRAIVHLPLGTWAHKSGSVLSLEWRLQRRNRASIDSVAPSLLDILNSISVQMEIDAIAESEEELFAKMREYVGQWPIQPADGLASEGFVLDWSHLPEPKIEKSGTDTAANPEASKLRLIHKRYLYSDREEIFFSPVFSGVPIPNCAVINPTDAEMLGIASSEKVVIRGEMEGSLEVQLVIGDWVKPGHIILNDYLTSTPANSAGRHATPVEVKVLASVREESE
jgi:anaerobic selenocysteine-containing dehydrogenase